MEVVEARKGTVLVLEPRGRLDSHSARTFEERLLGTIAGGAQALVIDAAQLDYVSSAGLRVLLLAAKRVRAARGHLALCCLKAHVREVFDVSGFTALFDLHDTREAAVGAVATDDVAV